MASRLQNLVGRKYNQLTVLEYGGSRQFSKSRESTWKCRCVCGKELVVAQRYLVTGGTKSCGCIVGKHKRTHGATGTTEYRAWDAMRRRCNDAGDTRYPGYGGRGIRVCERWMKFENFIADMGIRPSADHSLDRYPNNDGNYEPGNCRWATRVQQSNNRRSSRTLTINGQTKTYAQWERQVGLPAGRIFKRLKIGWSPDEVLQPSIRATGRRSRLQAEEAL